MGQELTFDQLPEAVSKMDERLAKIERLLERQQSEEIDQVFSIDGALQFLKEVTGKQYSKPSLYSMVSNGRIPASKKNGRLFFSRKQLTEWLLSGEREEISETKRKAIEKMQAARKK